MMICVPLGIKIAKLTGALGPACSLQAFNKMDASGDGKVDKAELKVGFYK